MRGPGTNGKLPAPPGAQEIAYEVVIEGDLLGLFIAMWRLAKAGK